jgi:PAS domain S-box-containing protein
VPEHNAWAAIPLVAHRTVLGALALSFGDPAAVRPAQRPGMLALASQCAQALERALLYNDISLANERLEAALDAGRMGWWEWDPERDRVVWSPSLERIYGLEPGGFGGTYEEYLARVHPDDRDAVRQAIEQGLSGEGHEFEHRIVTPSGEVRWVDGRGRVLRRGDGETRIGGLSMDVTERKRNEQALRFLAEASDLLSQTLDYERTLQRLAELVVDRLADWCAVTVVEDGRLVDVAVAHSDPAKVALVRDLQERYPQDADALSGAPAVIRSGRTEYLPSIPDELLVAVSPDADVLQALRDLGLRSVITAPLTARGRTFGAISMVLAESGSNYQPGDVELAEDLAHRAALAIDNARLFRERSEIADILQASLLPPVLPAIPGFDVAARYLPGGGGVRVGGDFYDVFPTREGRWQIVIGDVCGKGAPAATLTGVARHTGRAAAMDDDSPLHLLRAINAALRRTDTAEDLRFCTAAIGLLEPGAPSRVTIARAGHPPPLLRRADGTVAELGSPGTLLGVYDDPELHPATAELASGDALVLYTDGVPDSWWNAGGEARLAETIQGLPGGAAAAEVAARIEESALAGRESGGDDIAILVLRAL